MNSENIKTSEPCRLLLNIADKETYKEAINMLLYQIAAHPIHEKNI